VTARRGFRAIHPHFSSIDNRNDWAKSDNWPSIGH
jgi:hypothetical protein